MSRQATNEQAAERRTKDLARIHVAKKQLGLDEEAYRALLERVAGVRSSADLSTAGRSAVLREFARLGFKVMPGKRGHVGRPKGLEARPMLTKVEALLTDAGRPWNYAHGLAERMFEVKRVEWLGDDQLHRLIAALEIDARRRAQGER